MSRRAFFVYERGLKGPAPSVFYDGIPTVNGKPPALLGQHEIPGGTANRVAFPFEAESPDFGSLVRMFPAPEPTA